MNRDHISCFLTVAKYLSFSKAADALYISQPVVSRNIATFEQEIGVKLFTRSRNSVELTAAGKYLYGSLDAVMKDYQTAINNAVKIDKESHGTLAIGCAEGQTLYNYYDTVFSYFWKEKKNVQLTITYFPHSLLKNALNCGDIDLMIYAVGELDDSSLSDVNVIETRSEDACLVIPASHPKADMEYLTIDDFTNETFLVLDKAESPHVHEMQLETCRRNGFTNIRICPNISTISTLLESGMGVSSCNVWHSLTTSKKVKFLNVSGLGVVHEGIVWKKNNKNPNIPAFIEQINKLKQQ